MSIFSERLRELRDKKGHTQTELGKALGKSREAVSKYEIGEREPDLEAIASLSKYFNVSADYILGISDDYHTKGNKKYVFASDIYSYEKYFKDKNFIPVLKLGIKIFDYNLDVFKIEEFVNNMIKGLKNQKHP